MEDCTLGKLIDSVREGYWQIPDFQRSWCWDEERVKLLLDSILRNFLINNFIMIDENRHDLSFIPVAGVTLKRQVEPKILIMDGQQRATSIFQMFSPAGIVIINSDKKPKLCRLFIDIARFDFENKEGSSTTDAITCLPVDKDGKPSKRTVKTLGYDPTDDATQIDKGLISSADVFNPNAWNQRVHAQMKSNPAAGDNIMRKTDMLLKVGEMQARLSAYKIYLQRIDANTPLDVICEQYERLNRQGKPLGGYDLTVARFRRFGGNLRNDLEGPAGLVGKIQTFFEGFDARILPENCLQAIIVATHRDAGTIPTGVSKTDILKLSVSDFERNRKSVEQGFATLADMLKKQCLSRKWQLPPPQYLSCIAGVIAPYGPYGKTLKNIDAVQKAIMTWLWGTILKGTFDHGADKQFIKEVCDLGRWIDEIVGNAEAQTPSRRYAETIIQETDFAFEAQVGSLSNSLIAAMHLRNGAMEFANQGERLAISTSRGESYDMHHVFPQEWCKKNFIDEKLTNIIYNLAPINPQTNKGIGKLAPSQYLRVLMNEGGITEKKIAERMESQLIDVEFLKKDDFYGFFESWRRRTCALVHEQTNLLVEMSPAVTKDIPKKRAETAKMLAQSKQMSFGFEAFERKDLTAPSSSKARTGAHMKKAIRDRKSAARKAVPKRREVG